MGKAALHLHALAVVEVVCSQLTVRLVAGEHVIYDDEHGVPHGDDCPTFAPARGDAAELGR